MVQRARALAQRTSILTAVLMGGFVLWTALDQDKGGGKLAAQAIAVVAVGLAAAVAVPDRAAGVTAGFTLSAGAISCCSPACSSGSIPTRCPRPPPTPRTSLWCGSSASNYSQTVMTVVAVILVPVVLGYQGWTYWVFRHRLGRDDFEGPPPLSPCSNSRGQARQRVPTSRPGRRSPRGRPARRAWPPRSTVARSARAAGASPPRRWPAGSGSSGSALILAQASLLAYVIARRRSIVPASARSSLSSWPWPACWAPGQR